MYKKKAFELYKKKGEETLFTSCKRHFKKKKKPEHNPESLSKDTNGNLENTPSMLLKTQ